MFDRRTFFLILLSCGELGRSRCTIFKQPFRVTRRDPAENRTVTAIAAFYGDSPKKRDDRSVCGYYGHSTISCDHDAVCTVARLDQDAIGYCQRTSGLAFSDAMYVTAVDYSPSSFCWPGTTCCNSASPHGIEYQFASDGQTTRMFGCGTSAFTVKATPAANFVSQAATRYLSAFSTFAGELTNTTLESFPLKISNFVASPSGPASNALAGSASSTAASTSSNGDSGDRYQSASNISTIVGTAVGIPVGIAALVVAVYFGLKQVRAQKKGHEVLAAKETIH